MLLGTGDVGGDLGCCWEPGCWRGSGVLMGICCVDGGLWCWWGSVVLLEACRVGGDLGCLLGPEVFVGI